MKLYRIIIFSLILIFNFSQLNSQDIAAQKFRLGITYFKNGDLENAERLLLDATKLKPEERIYFNSYIEVLLELEEFNKALEISKSRLQTYNDLEILDTYAKINWKAGKPEIASEYWDMALEKYSKEISTYEKIASSQLSLRLYEKAIATLIKGRGELKSDYALADALSKLYTANQDYENGYEEIINLLAATKDIALAQGRLYAIMINEEAMNYIDDNLQELANSEKSNIYIQELYSWFLKTSGRYEKALEVIKRIDEMKGSKGREILIFGNSARQDGHHKIAIQAYLELMKDKSSPYVSSANYGLTRTQELVLLEKNEFTNQEVEELIKNYKNIIAQYPNSNNAIESYYRIALAYTNYTKDDSKALDVLEQLIFEYPNSNITHEAIILKGNILLKQEQLDKAKFTFMQLIKERRVKDDLKRKALYMQGEIFFFTSQIDSALQIYNLLVEYPESDEANDALDRIFLINQNLQFVKGLNKFSEAEYLRFKEQYKNAISYYKEAAEIANGSGLEQRSLRNIADIYFELKQYSNSKFAYEEILNKFPDTINKDYYLLKLGDCSRLTGNNAEAIEKYTSILKEFPNSIYLEEAREKLRSIRAEDS